jgi:DNA polymerase III delta subunit
MGRVREAAQAMPFLAERRVVVVSETQTLRADPRRDLFAVAQEVPEGNTLVLIDLLAPRSTRPQSFGTQAGRTALRVDTTADEATRARFVSETLERLGAKAEPRAVAALVGGTADLTAIRNDLEKLALAGKTITLPDLQREALAIEDPKPYKYASALVEGHLAQAFEIAEECFADNPRSGVPLLMALVTECGYLWALARPNGELPDRVKFRERFLRPLARRVGERRARAGFERALRGLEGLVTGRTSGDPDEQRALVVRISAELSRLARP